MGGLQNQSNPVHLTHPKSQQRTNIHNTNITHRQDFRTQLRNSLDCILLGHGSYWPGTSPMASSLTECYIVVLCYCYSITLHTIFSLIYFCLYYPHSLDLHQHESYIQPDEESQLTEESRSPPWESTCMCFQEDSQSSVEIKCLNIQLSLRL
jgi:hypothetical protein